MTVKHADSVRRYCSVVAELQNALANLQEFADSLPAPDEQGYLPFDYGFLGTFDELHKAIKQASQYSDVLSRS